MRLWSLKTQSSLEREALLRFHVTTAPFVEAVANTVSVRASKDLRNICQFRGMVHSSNNYSSQKLNDYKTEQSYETELHYKTEIYLIEN